MRRLSASIAVAALVISACGGSTEGKLGVELFEGTCATCHRPDGSGAGSFPAINAGSKAAGFTDEQIAGVIRAGPGAMPSFQKKLTEEQIESLVSFLRQLPGGSG